MSKNIMDVPSVGREHLPSLLKILLFSLQFSKRALKMPLIEIHSYSKCQCQ